MLNREHSDHPVRPTLHEPLQERASERLYLTRRRDHRGRQLARVARKNQSRRMQRHRQQQRVGALRRLIHHRRHKYQLRQQGGIHSTRRARDDRSRFQRGPFNIRRLLACIAKKSRGLALKLHALVARQCPALAAISDVPANRTRPAKPLARQLPRRSLLDASLQGAPLDAGAHASGVAEPNHLNSGAEQALAQVIDRRVARRRHQHLAALCKQLPNHFNKCASFSGTGRTMKTGNWLMLKKKGNGFPLRVVQRTVIESRRIHFAKGRRCLQKEARGHAPQRK